MAKLIFLGSGHAFCLGMHNFHSNLLLEVNGDYLMIDCGSDARHSLHEHGYSHMDIKNVYISHLHADHAGGLEWLAFTARYNKTIPSKPKLYIHESLLDKVWNNTLSGGLGTNACIDDFFEVAPIKKNGHFKWNDINFRTVRTVHVMNDRELMPSYGLFFTVNKKNIFFTSDTQFLPFNLNKFYEEADFIYHDCETSTFRTGVHAHFRDLSRLPGHIKKKMWLYHYNTIELPDAKKKGFAGFVHKGQQFKL